MQHDVSATEFTTVLALYLQTRALREAWPDGAKRRDGRRIASPDPNTHSEEKTGVTTTSPLKQIQADENPGEPWTGPQVLVVGQGLVL